MLQNGLFQNGRCGRVVHGIFFFWMVVVGIVIVGRIVVGNDLAWTNDALWLSWIDNHVDIDKVNVATRWRRQHDTRAVALRWLLLFLVLRKAMVMVVVVVVVVMTSCCRGRG